MKVEKNYCDEIEQLKKDIFMGFHYEEIYCDFNDKNKENVYNKAWDEYENYVEKYNCFEYTEKEIIYYELLEKWLQNLNFLLHK